MTGSDQLPPSGASAPAEKQHTLTLWPLDETARNAHASGWCVLDTRGLLRVSGTDAESYLQGQLTQDMARVRAGAVLLAAHCTPKGRVSTLFRCWHDAHGFLLDCPASMLSVAQRRLGLYVMRAAVKISAVADQYHRVGVWGRELAARLAEKGISMPDQPGTTVLSGTMQCTALPGDRWLLLCDGTADPRLHAMLGQENEADAHAWRLASLLAGEPEVLPETAEQFIPQMLNLDLLDGVSFRKGCYTGQEIVARTHYLGRVKRRMQCFSYRGATAPDIGTVLQLAPAAEAADAAPPPAPLTAQLVIAAQDNLHGGLVLAVLAVPAADASDDDTARPTVS